MTCIAIYDAESDSIGTIFHRAGGIATGTGDLIAEIADFASDDRATPHVVLANHRGDTVMTIDATSGTVSSHIHYDAFGNVKHTTGTFSPTYTFSTKEFLEEVALYLYAYRAYDPESGRWTQRDPIDYQDAINLYQFCGNNPVNITDPDGTTNHQNPANLDFGEFYIEKVMLEHCPKINNSIVITEVAKGYNSFGFKNKPLGTSQYLLSATTAFRNRITRNENNLGSSYTYDNWDTAFWDAGVGYYAASDIKWDNPNHLYYNYNGKLVRGDEVNYALLGYMHKKGGVSERTGRLGIWFYKNANLYGYDEDTFNFYILGRELDDEIDKETQ